jgi:hypothetical protein
MLKKVTIGLAALAAAGFATSAMAANPWAPGQTTVPVTITVQEMTELFTDVTPVGLSIVDSGENQGSAQAVTRMINHIHNVGVDVSASIDNNIPDNTQFHILVGPAASWATPAASGAEKTVSWRREGGNYIAADGGFPNQVSSSGVGNAVLAFSAAANAGNGDPTTKTVQYFADSRNVMAAVGSAAFNVVWTIAPQSQP